MDEIMAINGRPKKYTPDFLDSLADDLILYVKTAKIPFLKEFCFNHNFGSQRISEFAKDSQKFSEALNRFKDLFEAKIVQGSLAGELNGYMAMNTLKNCSGWRDKQEHEHSGGININTVSFKNKVPELAHEVPELSHDG